LIGDLLSVVTIADKPAAQKIQKDYAAHQAKWNDDLGKLKEQADSFEAAVEKSEHRADRFDLGEALLEIGLVITSVTLLTRTTIYWYFGMAFAVAGLVSVISAFFLHL
jgi:hypothetical protein